jgi:beta-N-acetylhexosaminidase
LTTILRKRIGYRGLIFSDDLEMGGVLKFLPMEGAAIEAIRAGMDLIEICHSPELILCAAMKRLSARRERSVAFRGLLLERAAIARKLRRVRFGGPLSWALSVAQLEALRDKVRRFAATVEEARG